MKTLKIRQWWNGGYEQHSDGKEMDVLEFTERREEGIFGEIIVLENGIELYPNEWNGEVYNVKGKVYKQVYNATENDPESYDTIGFIEL